MTVTDKSQQVQDQNTNGNAPDNGGQDQAPDTQTQAQAEHTIPKSRFDEVNEKRKALETELQAVADQMVEDIPENYRELVPNLPAADKIKWIRSAAKSGIFNPPTPASPDTKRPNDRPNVDFSNMSPLQMREAGYK